MENDTFGYFFKRSLFSRHHFNILSSYTCHRQSVPVSTASSNISHIKIWFSSINVFFDDLDYPELSKHLQYLNTVLALDKYAIKLILDFLVLLCASCQSNVFRIECTQNIFNFAGGSNECVVKKIALICAGELPHKTHDFVHPRNWLDILKCAIYFGFFWMTLAVLLLTGTYNINVFSFGYVIAAFGFCFVGAHFYMKSMTCILVWWKMLMTFNLIVILVKITLSLKIKPFLYTEWLTSIRSIHQDMLPSEVRQCLFQRIFLAPFVLFANKNCLFLQF